MSTRRSRRQAPSSVVVDMMMRLRMIKSHICKVELRVTGAGSDRGERVSDVQAVGCHAFAALAASAPFVGTSRLVGTVRVIGTGAARSGRISSMGIGKTIVEF
jgi:hypothetical protein